MSESFSVALAYDLPADDPRKAKDKGVALKATFSSHGNYRGTVEYTLIGEAGPDLPESISPASGSVYVPKDRDVIVPVNVVIPTGSCRVIVTAWDSEDTHEDDIIVSMAAAPAPG